ncbi:putative global transcription activator SNF2L2 [Smittium culicis]|uniref:Putative global transcription activator SNF2L2 n=1 Tax=Smittium culicis TaxID=133412 RepID=A0A1R1YAV9_9FUNG|nr:putative global transcription activator SNF2L2 [Smittium culicis]
MMSQNIPGSAHTTQDASAEISARLPSNISEPVIKNIKLKFQNLVINNPSKLDSFTPPKPKDSSKTPRKRSDLSLSNRSSLEYSLPKLKITSSSTSSELSSALPPPSNTNSHKTKSLKIKISTPLLNNNTTPSIKLKMRTSSSSSSLSSTFSNINSENILSSDLNSDIFSNSTDFTNSISVSNNEPSSKNPLLEPNSKNNLISDQSSSQNTTSNSSLPSPVSSTAVTSNKLINLESNSTSTNSPLSSKYVHPSLFYLYFTTIQRPTDTSDQNLTTPNTEPNSSNNIQNTSISNPLKISFSNTEIDNQQPHQIQNSKNDLIPSVTNLNTLVDTNPVNESLLNPTTSNTLSNSSNAKNSIFSDTNNTDFNTSQNQSLANANNEPLQESPSNINDTENPQVTISDLFELVYSGDIKSFYQYISNSESLNLDLDAFGPISLNRDRRLADPVVTKKSSSKRSNNKGLQSQKNDVINNINDNSDLPSDIGEGFWTLLHASCYYGRTKMVAILCQSNKVDVEKTDSLHGSTAVGWAAYGGHPNTLSRLIVDGNPNLNVKNNHGQSPIDMVPNPESLKWKSMLDTSEESIKKRRKSTKKLVILDPSTPNTTKTSQNKPPVDSSVRTTTRTRSAITSTPKTSKPPVEEDDDDDDDTFSDSSSTLDKNKQPNSPTKKPSKNPAQDLEGSDGPSEKASTLRKMYPSLNWEDLPAEKKKSLLEKSPPEIKAMSELLEAVLFHTDIEGDRLSGVFESLPDFDDYPDYYEVFKDPISLDLVSYRLFNLKYTSFSQFDSDIIRIFHNACYYNVHGSEIYTDSLALLSVYCSARRSIVEKYNIKFDLKIAEQKPLRGRYVPRALEGDLDLAVGDCVLASTVDKKEKLGIILRISVSGPRDRVIILDLMWFLRPSETDLPSFNNSYPHELVLDPTLSIGVQAKSVTKRVVILPIKTYVGFYPSGFEKEDVYLCEYTLIPNSKRVMPLTVWPSPSPLQQPVDHYINFHKYPYPLPIKRVPLDLWDNPRYLPNPPPAPQNINSLQVIQNIQRNNSTMNALRSTPVQYTPPTAFTNPSQPTSSNTPSNNNRPLQRPPFNPSMLNNQQYRPYMNFSSTPKPNQMNQNPFTPQSSLQNPNLNIKQQINPIQTPATSQPQNIYFDKYIKQNVPSISQPNFAQDSTTQQNQMIPSQTNPNQLNPSNINPNQMIQNQMNPNQINSNQMIPNQINPNQMIPNQMYIRPHGTSNLPTQPYDIRQQPNSSYSNTSTLYKNTPSNLSMNSAVSQTPNPSLQKNNTKEISLDEDVNVFKRLGEREFISQLSNPNTGESSSSPLSNISNSGLFCLQISGIYNSQNSGIKNLNSDLNLFQHWNSNLLTNFNHSIQVPSHICRILLRPIYPITNDFQKNDSTYENIGTGYISDERITCSLNLNHVEPQFMQGLYDPLSESSDKIVGESVPTNTKTPMINLDSLHKDDISTLEKPNLVNLKGNLERINQFLWRKNLIFDAAILPGLNIIKIEFNPPTLWESMLCSLQKNNTPSPACTDTSNVSGPDTSLQPKPSSNPDTSNSHPRVFINRPITHTIFITRV